MYFKTVRRHELNYKLSPNAFIGKLLGISVAWYSLFVLKVPLKPNQPTFGDFWRRIFISWISFLSPSEQHQCMTVGRFFCACLWITYLCTERCVKFFFITIIVSRVRRWRTWKPIMTQQPQHFAQLANSSSVLSSVCLNLNIINNYFINSTVRTECKGIWYQSKLIRDLNPDFWINPDSNPDVCRVSSKMMWICYVVGVSQFAAHSLTHCCAWPAEGRSVLHIERSWPAIQAAPTDRPVSSSNCCSQDTDRKISL